MSPSAVSGFGCRVTCAQSAEERERRHGSMRGSIALAGIERQALNRRSRTMTRHRPGQRPDPDLPAGTDMLPAIKHIIVLMMENHSFDNYLGTLGRGDG